MRKTVIELTDDLTGGKADETIEFSFDGIRYEIDLSAINADSFRQQLGPWLEAARLALPASRRRRTTEDRRRSARIRAWAIDQGIPVAHGGRISIEVLRRYQARG